jgi:hypothetical protein
VIDMSDDTKVTDFISGRHCVYYLKTGRP